MREEEKKIAGEKATEFVRDGMVLGLGSGSTVAYTIKKIGALIKEKKILLECVSTSNETTILAKSLDIPLIPIHNVSGIDLTIDGADEIDPQFNGIKGGGGALLFEKVIANASKQNIWVVDGIKMVKDLGKFPLPVEILPFGYTHTIKHMESKGYKPMLRYKNEKVFITDSGNYIVDLQLASINDPVVLEKELNCIPGVIENGLFIKTVDKVIVAEEKNTRILNATF